MTLKFSDATKLRLNRFARLGTWYILALSGIAAIAIIGQVLIQNHLKDQLSDSRVVNVAGRQRMLSQKISKHALQLSPHQDAGERAVILKNLNGSLELWKLSHEGLQNGNDSLHLPGINSAEVSKMFKQINPYFDEMYSSAKQVIGELQNVSSADYELIKENVDKILKNESAFLSGMNQIVFQYDEEARIKIETLSRLEYFLIFISLLVIAVEILFIFRPTAAQVNKTVNQLIASEQNAKQLTKEIGALYGSLEKSYEQLSQINQPIETPKLCAKADRGGNVTFISDLFSEAVGIQNISSATRLCELFPGSDLGDDWMDEIVESVSEGQSWQGEIHYTGADNFKRWAEVIVMPIFNENDEIEELMALASDITLQKQAEQSMRKKNRAEVEKKINQQKFRSVLILEGQEEERKRIAMDIHDGIGQMLTSLKFQIESIDSRNDVVIDRKVGDIKHQIKDVIKEV